MDKTEIGDAGDALDFALDHIDDSYARTDFLEGWRLGDVSEWPEYTRWLAVQYPNGRRPTVPEGLVKARALAAREVEGDSDNPLRVAEANRIYAGERDDSELVQRHLATLREGSRDDS